METIVEVILGAAGFEVAETGSGACPFVYGDEETYLAAKAANEPAQGIIGHVGREAFDEAVLEAGAPYRRDDGSYRFENRYRYVAGTRPGV